MKTRVSPFFSFFPCCSKQTIQKIVPQTCFIRKKRLENIFFNRKENTHQKRPFLFLALWGITSFFYWRLKIVFRNVWWGSPPFLKVSCQTSMTPPLRSPSTCCRSGRCVASTMRRLLWRADFQHWPVDAAGRALMQWRIFYSRTCWSYFGDWTM